MSEPFEEIAGMDKLIHEPARLALLTALSVCKSADFTYLQRLTGLTQGNLSGHLGKLEEAGYLRITKQISGKRPLTTISITPGVRQAIEKHWAGLERLRDQARSWQPDDQ
jgi:DNA-binding MarR family transcriptional regulator